MPIIVSPSTPVATALLTSYAELVAALDIYLGRSDSSTIADYLIAEAEAEMNARLRVRRMLTSLVPTVSGTGSVTIPADFGGWKRFSAVNGGVARDLALLTAESQRDIQRTTSMPGTPKAVITLGAASQVWPYGDSNWTYEALYFARIPNLNAVDDTNWVILVHPVAYLYGCLAAARGYASDEKVDLWEKRFDRAVERIEEEDSLETNASDHAILAPNTSLFGGGGAYNVLTDGR